MSLELKAIAILVLLVSLSAGAIGLHHHIFQQGVTQEKNRRDKIDADAVIKNAENNRLIKSAQAATNQRVSQDYETKLAQAVEEGNILRAAVARSGGLHLPADSNPAAMPGSAASPAGTDAACDGKLPDQFAELLLSESARADKIAEQLTALQAFIRANGMGQ